MPSFALGQYRSQKQQAARTRVVEDIIAALSNPDNLAVWKQGIEPAAESAPDYQVFFYTMIDQAADIARGDNTQRFFANDVEFVLDVQRVSAYIVQALENPEQAAQRARQFVEEGLFAAPQLRNHMRTAAP